MEKIFDFSTYLDKNSNQKRIYVSNSESTLICVEKLISMMYAIENNQEVPVVKLANFDDFLQPLYFAGLSNTCDGGRHRLLSYMLLGKPMKYIETDFDMRGDFKLKTQKLFSNERILLEKNSLEISCSSVRISAREGKYYFLPSPDELFDNNSHIVDLINTHIRNTWAFSSLERDLYSIYYGWDWPEGRIAI